MHQTQPHTSVLQSKIQALETIVHALKQAPSIKEKLLLLDENEDIQRFLTAKPEVSRCLNTLPPDEKYVLKAIIALGQGPLLFSTSGAPDALASGLKKTLKSLTEIEQFYSVIGGLIGYHVTVLKLIAEKHQGTQSSSPKTNYRKPVGLDLSKKTAEVRQATRWGIAALPHMAEIYPVGGSGDRLNLHDDVTGEALPVAALSFAGRSLLEGLVNDLKAREYLYYKLFDTQLTTPIAMMTSHEKDNHQHILALCKELQWFGRDPESIRFFTQPLVPVMTIEGNWVLQEPLKLLLKPGGHGVIWKLAIDQGIFNWFSSQDRHYALIRQINNPVAGTDYGLIAFIGIGSHDKKTFGFASCERRLNAAEGMDVLIESETDQGIEYRISNIEYTEFEQKGIKDVPAKPGSPYSQFPANTNILFADLKAIIPVANACPIPGMLINMKNHVTVKNEDGTERTVAAGRLESTMQNIADHISDSFPKHLQKVTPADLRSYITYNERHKTLSVTKKAYTPEGAFLETPEGCFYELLQNHYDLFKHHCRMELPELGDEENYRRHGPAFIAGLHPALGPMYAIICQKIQGGSLARGSELQLEIAEVEIQNLHLDGSLLIFADAPMGKKDSLGRIEYGETAGKCTLRSVTVRNKGIDRSATDHFCMHHIVRQEAMRIILHGSAEFFAENVTFSGSHELEVPDGHRMVAYMRGEAVHYRVERIYAPTWYWKYSFAGDDQVKLQKTAPQIA